MTADSPVRDRGAREPHGTDGQFNARDRPRRIPPRRCPLGRRVSGSRSSCTESAENRSNCAIRTRPRTAAIRTRSGFCYRPLDWGMSGNHKSGNRPAAGASGAARSTGTRLRRGSRV